MNKWWQKIIRTINLDVMSFFPTLCILRGQEQLTEATGKWNDLKFVVYLANIESRCEKTDYQLLSF